MLARRLRRRANIKQTSIYRVSAFIHLDVGWVKKRTNNCVLGGAWVGRVETKNTAHNMS